MNAKADSPCALKIAKGSLVFHRSPTPKYLNPYLTPIIMDITEATIPRGQILLRRRQDWPAWYNQLRFLCLDKDIWDDINPQEKSVLPISKTEPLFPTLPTHPGIEPPQVNPDQTQNPQHALWRAQRDTYDLARATHSDDLNMYKIRIAQWTRKAAKLASVRDFGSQHPRIGESAVPIPPRQNQWGTR